MTQYPGIPRARWRQVFQVYLHDISAIALLLLPMTLANAIAMLTGQGFARAGWGETASLFFRLSDLLINLYPLALCVVTSYYLSHKSSLNSAAFLVYSLVLLYALANANGLLSSHFHLPGSSLLALLCPLLTLLYSRSFTLPALAPQSLDFAASLGRHVAHFFCFALFCLLLSVVSPWLLQQLGAMLVRLTPDPLTLSGGLLYQFSLGLLGAIGINGHNFLLATKQMLFHVTEQNLLAWQAAEAPLNVISQGFYDAFMSMGGSGNSISLLLCILLFPRSRNHLLLALAAAPMVLFNINEVLLFGLPIIFNPLLIIPFIGVPLISFVIAYVAISSGLVPPVAAIVDWMTPPLLSGYFAMGGQLEGALLQLVLILVGVLIYRPFYKAFAGRDLPQAGGHVQQLSLNNMLEEIKNAARHNRRLARAQRRVQQMMRQGEWVMHYQRQHALRGRSANSFEALIRYRDPDGTLHGPRFIADFQRLNAMPLLDHKVLQLVLADMQQLPLAQLGRIAINVSAMTLQQPGFVDQLAEWLSAYALPADKLELEITEEVLLDDQSTLLSIMARLQQMGIHIALDDFGAGFASFPHLMKYPFDKVKLDRALLLDCHHHKGRHLYRLLAQIGTLANCKVLAEGVETEEERQFVASCGIDLIQGYLFARPVPLAEVIRVLEEPTLHRELVQLDVEPHSQPPQG